MRASRRFGTNVGRSLPTLKERPFNFWKSRMVWVVELPEEIHSVVHDALIVIFVIVRGVLQALFIKIVEESCKTRGSLWKCNHFTWVTVQTYERWHFPGWKRRDHRGRPSTVRERYPGRASFRELAYQDLPNIWGRSDQVAEVKESAGLPDVRWTTSILV